MADQNKTQLTREITAAAVAWLDAKGFKPIETEVPVTAGWIADVAGIICPTTTELINLKLLRRKPRYRDNHSVYKDWKTDRDWFPLHITGLVEVKTSRGDFLKEKKWSIISPTHLCWLAVPAGLIQANEHWAGWGVLEFNKSKQLRIVQQAEFMRVNSPHEILCVCHNIGIRRDHHTRYARFREQRSNKQQQHNEYKTRARITVCIRAVTDIFTGKHTVEEAMEKARIKCLSEYDLDRLEAIYKKGSDLCRR
jgi:hypothetical protein